MHPLISIQRPIAAVLIPYSTIYAISKKDLTELNLPEMEVILWAAGWLPPERNNLVAMRWMLWELSREKVQ